ncbi:MAG: hypothetical protein GF320_17070 [Armatimonadia bacterium]|nr:hypothetical protein [Armatimonadia bacterium]
MRVIALLSVLTLAPGAGAVDLPPDVDLSTDAAEPWTWHGIPTGPQELLGLTIALPAPPEGSAAIPGRAGAVSLAGEASTLVAVVTPVVTPHLASLSYRASGEWRSVPVGDMSLAWVSEPPHERFLLMAVLKADASIAEVRPEGCYLLALEAVDADPLADPDVASQWEAGAEAWQARMESLVPASWRMRELVDTIPGGAIAMLPPRSGVPGILRKFMGATSLGSKIDELTPRQMVDPGQFSAAQYPFALQVGQEQYHRSVLAPDDGAEALLRYLEEGGTLVLASTGPYPMYYALDSGAPAPQHGDAFVHRLGIRATFSMERPPEGQGMSLHRAAPDALPSMPESVPYPTTGDLRIRCLGAPNAPEITTTPLVELRDAQGQTRGHAAALFELASGGRVMFIWGGLLAHPKTGDAVMGDLIRWVAEELEAMPR